MEIIILKLKLDKTTLNLMNQCGRFFIIIMDAMLKYKFDIDGKMK